MQYYDIVFVVLVYKNTEVLSDFFKTLKIPFSYHVIVVNSFFDEESEKTCEFISKENNATFIPVPNKGYGAGNNIGCAYAIKHYDFNYLIISNSDIVVKSLSCLKKLKYDTAIFAPETSMLNGHKQNPNIPYNSKIYIGLLKLGYRFNLPKIKLLGLVVNRFYRELAFLYMRLFRRKVLRIFSAHGSFIVFTKEAVIKLHPIFNDEMFLYNEELFLAYNCRQKNVPVIYSPELKVLHLEGASSSETLNSWTIRKESFSLLMKWKKKHRI